MSIRSVFLALVALAVATPAALRAQENDADFVKARQQFVAGQARAAAQTLMFASAAVRQQTGRCKDADVGSRLMDAESQLDKLSASLRAGSVTSVKTLEKSLASIDLLLAQHHLMLSLANMDRPRPSDIPVVAQDIDRGAFHYERSVTLGGGKLTTEQAAAVAEVRALVKEIENSSAIPKKAVALVTSFEKLVVGATTVSDVR
jgi:hypothetical protein